MFSVVGRRLTYGIIDCTSIILLRLPPHVVSGNSVYMEKTVFAGFWSPSRESIRGAGEQSRAAHPVRFLEGSYRGTGGSRKSGPVLSMFIYFHVRSIFPLGVSSHALLATREADQRWYNRCSVTWRISGICTILMYSAIAGKPALFLPFGISITWLCDRIRGNAHVRDIQQEFQSLVVGFDTWPGESGDEHRTCCECSNIAPPHIFV